MILNVASGSAPGSMLLLTDSPIECRRLQTVFSREQTCTMLALENAKHRSARHLMVACHVSRDETLASPLLGAAIAHHRADPDMPLLFVMRDRSEAALSAAEAFGARVVPHDADEDELMLALKRWRASYKSYVYDRAPGKMHVPPEIATVARGIGEVLSAVSRNEAIALTSLERSAETLLASVKGTDLKDWLAMVRRYDDGIYQHCLIVSGLVTAFSMRLGFALANQLLLAQAALLHDIGKASVPRRILNKAGPLTADEAAAMRRHPGAGHARLLLQGGVDPTILDVVRHHHELLDGSGYPDALRQEQISEAVRLVTVCDIYGALIERRAYKAPMPSEEALTILHGMAGKLDAALLTSFAEMVRDL